MTQKSKKRVDFRVKRSFGLDDLERIIELKKQKLAVVVISINSYGKNIWFSIKDETEGVVQSLKDIMAEVFGDDLEQ